MAEMASYCGIEPRTIIVGASTIAKGFRVVKDANGVCAVAGDTVRGEFVTLATGLTGEAIAAVDTAAAGKCIAYAGEAGVDAGDLAYAFAGGKFGVTATNVALMGKWTTTTAVNTLGEVELFSVA